MNIKSHLKQPNTNLKQAMRAMRASRFYKEILNEIGIPTTNATGSGEIKQETMNEYRRVQVQAHKNDKPLNKAFGQLIAACLKEDAPSLELNTEKRSLPGSTLQPDIHIQIGSNDFLCLEPTWRSTGEGIGGELEKRQNTLAEAHIKKYVLDKAGEYIKDLDL